MSVVGSGAHSGVQASKKGGIRETKIEGMKGAKNTLAWEKDRRKLIGSRLKSPSNSIMMDEIKS